MIDLFHPFAFTIELVQGSVYACYSAISYTEYSTIHGGHNSLTFSNRVTPLILILLVSL